MPLTFRPTPTGYQQASYNQLIPTPITNLVAVSNLPGQITLTWSGGDGYNIKYSYAISTGTLVYALGINPTTLQLSSQNSINTTVTLTGTVLGGSTTATSANVTTKVLGVQSFTTINSSATASVITTPSGYGSGTPYGMAVDYGQAKMLFAFSGNVYYATSSNSGANWTGFTTVNLDTSSTNRHACGLRNDGQYGYVVTAQKTYTVNWTGATPTFTAFDTTVAPLCVNIGYFGATMTPDGLTLIVTPYQGTIYYTRFTGTTFNTFTTSGLTTDRMGVAISPDSSTLFVSKNSGDQYTTITWNGNTGTFTSLVSTNSGHPDDRAYIFLGGDYAGLSPPKYLFGGSGNLYYYTWDQTGKTASSTVTTLTTGSMNPDSNNSFSACGAKGNIIYYVNGGIIYKLTLNVT